MTKMIKFFLWCVCISILVFGWFFITRSFSSRQFQMHTPMSNVQLPLTTTVRSPQGIDIRVRVANTEKTRELGLSGFIDLPTGQGMLFVFPQVGIYSFWMKDMNFPLDMIWIDENGSVVYRVINADPSSYPKTFTPSASARYVLEIPAHTADDYGFLVGSSVIIKK
jgi:uncharacterized membrane protein (UPF0127 family)